jgi:hypothetical protein
VADLLVYGASSAFALLFSYWMHHAYITTKMMKQMLIEERADVRRLNALMAEVHGRLAPSPGPATAMCLGCGAQTASPNSAYCTDCHGRLPQLRRKTEPTSPGVGGPTTPAGVRL